MLVNAITAPSSSDRKPMFLLHPMLRSPKYFSKNAWVSTTSVTVRLRWFSFIPGPPMYSYPGTDRGVREPAEAGGGRRVRLPLQGFLRKLISMLAHPYATIMRVDCDAAPV